MHNVILKTANMFFYRLVIILFFSMWSVFCSLSAEFAFKKNAQLKQLRFRKWNSKTQWPQVNPLWACVNMQRSACSSVESQIHAHCGRDLIIIRTVNGSVAMETCWHRKQRLQQTNVLPNSSKVRCRAIWKVDILILVRLVNTLVSRPPPSSSSNSGGT